MGVTGSSTIEVKISGDAARNMARMLAYIGKIGGYGHSFNITVDPRDSEYERDFGFDGDGSDSIESVKLDGKAVEAEKRSGAYQLGTAVAQNRNGVPKLGTV